MTITKIAISLIATSVLFTACGGGGGDDTPVTGTENPPPNSNNLSVKTPTTYDVIAGKTTYVSVLTGKDYINTDNGQSFYTYSVIDSGNATADFDASNYGNLRYINSGSNDVVKIAIKDNNTGATIEQDLVFNIIDESSADTIKVLKTGQADGDAGEDRKFVRTTQTPSGDVKDEVNNITWSDTTGQYGYLAKGAVTFTEAKKECIKKGSRLPTIEELFTTLYYAPGRYQGEKGMLDDAFKARENAWYFWADSDKILNYKTGLLSAGDNANFRCIKDGSLKVDKHLMYTEGDIITHDLSTGLAWTTSDKRLNFSEAKNYCENLGNSQNDAVYGTGWKLPTINQLRSIVDDGLIAAAILNGQPSLLSSTEVEADGLPYHLFLLPTEGRTNYKVETAGEADVHGITCVKKDQ